MAQAAAKRKTVAKVLAADKAAKSAALSDDHLIPLLRRKRLTIPEIATKTGNSHRAVTRAIRDMQRRGVLVYQFGSQFGIEKAPAFDDSTRHRYHSRPDGTYLFGFCGDNHLGSKYERLDVLNDLYDKFAAAEVDRVLNAGNWIDGEARFNKHDLTVHGMDNQVAYLVENYPQREGIVTYSVAGDDHEGWYGQSAGIDIGRHAERMMREADRTDWVHLGYMEAFVDLVHAKSRQSTKLLLAHPGGGSAYALSYTTQKGVEAFEGGEKPAVVIYGHYHKLWFGNIRNVWCLQSGCFTGNTLIETALGRKKIRSIKVGDVVKTHTGAYQRVTKVFTRKHYGDFVSINYGRKGRFDQTLTATPEHPILVERRGTRSWQPIADISAGDVVFVESAQCVSCGAHIPYWMRLCKNCNPMDIDGTRDKLSRTKGGCKRSRGGSCGQKHLEQDVLPFCRQKESEGWKMVPVGAGVIPDAIGFKDGRVVAFEIERGRGRLLDFKKSKYNSAGIADFVDAVEWVPVGGRIEQPRSWYEYDDATGMCKVMVIDKQTKSQEGRRNSFTHVYNFEVDIDNSYIAGRMAVHNCTQDQTTFMRKKRLEAHVGGGICQLTQDKNTGAIIACRVEFFRYFNKGYYNHRWSHGGAVTLPARM